MADEAALVVLVTAPDPGSAGELARRLVEARVAACVNIVPAVRSVYRWQGRIEDEGESLMICKTTERALPALRRTVEDVHPYDVPEVLALRVADGSPAYLAWLVGEVGS